MRDHRNVADYGGGKGDDGCRGYHGYVSRHDRERRSDGGAYGRGDLGRKFDRRDDYVIFGHDVE